MNVIARHVKGDCVQYVVANSSNETSKFHIIFIKGLRIAYATEQ